VTYQNSIDAPLGQKFKNMANFLIIGGSSGIGKQLVTQLAANQHQVYATYKQTAITNSSSQINYHYLDVLEDTLTLDFLPEVIDGLVYCPGSITLKPFNRIKPALFIEDYQLQVVGAVKVLQAVLPKLKKSEKASVLFFSTIAVQAGFNFHSLVSASKGAIEGLTKALAAELAPTIRVNCIAPSLTDTPLASFLLNSETKKEANAQKNPLKRIGQAADLANMATFLLSEKSSWITGQIFAVDGGMSTLK